MRTEKQLLLDDVKEKLTEAKAFVVARYEKMNAQASGDLRNSVRKTGGDFEVLKKRVFVKAAEAAGIEGFDVSELEGSIGVFLANEDPIDTTKAVFEFAKKNTDMLTVLSGRFDGQVYTKDQVKALSELPSKDELRAQFLALLEAPMAETLSVMDALLCSPIHCIENKRRMDAGEE